MDFKIITPHTPNLRWDYHHWFFPNGYRGVPATEMRDKAGKRPGRRAGYFPEWFVLECNNTECEGRAVVPVEFVLQHADASDPDSTR